MSQPPYPFQYVSYVPPLLCTQCGTELSPALLACPRCQRLVHSGRLNQLAVEAKAAADAGDLTTAQAKWREALSLLPRESRQHAVVLERINSLGREIETRGPTASRGNGQADARHGSAAGRAAGAGGALALLLSLLAKGKLLLLGLTKASTLFSMLASIGAYWLAFGWKFAVGLVLTIYVHEMGHVARLLRYGMKATPPMFVPGLGALIMLKQHPASAREDARIGLAGPTWGLAAAAVAYAVSLASGWPSWAATGQVAGWLNFFNLTPVWQLDGSRGFRALSNRQRWAVVAAMGVMALIARDAFIGVIAAVAASRALADRSNAPPQGDRGAFHLFLFLVVGCALMSEVPVPGHDSTGSLFGPPVPVGR
jgi:Zn-dependent protease